MLDALIRAMGKQEWIEEARNLPESKQEEVMVMMKRGYKVGQVAKAVGLGVGVVVVVVTMVLDKTGDSSGR